MPSNSSFGYSVIEPVQPTLEHAFQERVFLQASSNQHTLVEQLASDSENDPITYREAISRQDGVKWQRAIATELDNLKRNRVFVEVVKPRGLGKLIGCRYVFKTKMKNGKIDKYKARLVAKGYSQV